jgi:hypothetical protein
MPKLPSLAVQAVPAWRAALADLRHVLESKGAKIGKGDAALVAHCVEMVAKSHKITLPDRCNPVGRPWPSLDQPAKSR